MAAVSEQQSAGRSAHGAAIKALTDARQNTRNYRFLMEKSDRVVEDAIFIDPDDDNHPQKLAHAALIDFHEEVNQPEYTVKMNDVWQETLSGQDGEEITVEVPREDRVRKVATDDDINSVLPDREGIDTKTEHVSLESLSHRWSGRCITVVVEQDSPYYASSGTREKKVRVWLPPKAIKAAYRQLNSALSKIGLLAQTSAPVEHDPDPI